MPERTSLCFIILIDSKNGKIVEKTDGSLMIEWKKELAESGGFSDSVTTVLTKGKNEV